MSNASYHQPRLDIEPTKLLARTIYAHTGYVSSVAFFGTQCDRLITGSYDETAKVGVRVCVQKDQLLQAGKR